MMKFSCYVLILFCQRLLLYAEFFISMPKFQWTTKTLIKVGVLSQKYFLQENGLKSFSCDNCASLEEKKLGERILRSTYMWACAWFLVTFIL